MDLEKLRLRIYLGVFLLVLMGSTVVFVVVEGLSFFDALYYTLVTVSTVGYGDISPETSIGKLMAILLIVTGVGTFLGVIGNATEIFIKKEEDKKRNKKAHILSGLLFSEVGNHLLRMIQRQDKKLEQTKSLLHFLPQDLHKDYLNKRKQIQSHEFEYDVEHCQFNEIYDLLKQQKEFLMRMLENPMLLEGEDLTELLRSIFHLYEEFTYRLNIDELSPSDYSHLHIDMMRVYKGLLLEWINYMEYLHQNFPSLYNFNRLEGPFGKL